MSSFRMGRIVALSMFTAALSQAGTVVTVDGPISVTSVVTQSGSLYEYDYSIADGTGLLAVLDIDVTPGISITGLTAPGGSSAFMTAYDSGLGLVSFLDNNAVFPSTSESGFIFYSPIAPMATNFGVTLFDGTTGTADGIQGPVVPEPASTTLFLFGGVVLLFWRKRMTASRLV